MDLQSPPVNLFVWLQSVHGACGNVTNPSMTDSECSQSDLRITLASFAFRRCSLAISRRYPLISHAQQRLSCRFQRTRSSISGCAGVCGSPVPGVADSTSVRYRVINNAWCICAYHALHGGLPCHKRPVSVVGGFYRHCSACAECTQLSNGVRGKRQRVASSFQPFLTPIVRCANHLFLDLLMVSCRLELCNPLDRTTHISGARLDASSSLPVVLWTSWCTMGCNVAQVLLCVAQCWGLDKLVSLPTRPDPVRGPITHFDQCACRAPSVECASPRSVPVQSSRDCVFYETIAILHRHALAQRCHRRCRQPSWWTPKCHQACVAQNGAWRDHRRAPFAAARERFRNARTSFHRVVRRCQNQFWSDWQENITSLLREPQAPESNRCSVVSQDVTSRIWSGGYRERHNFIKIEMNLSLFIKKDFHQKPISSKTISPSTRNPEPQTQKHLNT